MTETDLLFICLRDGRESAIVTKLFLVEYVPSNEPPSTEDNEENFLKEYERGLPRQV